MCWLYLHSQQMLHGSQFSFLSSGGGNNKQGSKITPQKAPGEPSFLKTVPLILWSQLLGLGAVLQDSQNGILVILPWYLECSFSCFRGVPTLVADLDASLGSPLLCLHRMVTPLGVDGLAPAVCTDSTTGLTPS